MKTVVNGVETNYCILGEGRPLLFLSGFGLDHTAMMAAFEPIVADWLGWQRVYVDLPGTGETAVAEDLASSDAILSFVQAFVAQQLPGQSFAVVGFSYGGYIARGLVRRWPERLDGVMLLCPVVTAGADKRSLPEPTVLINEPGALELLPEPFRQEMGPIMVVQTRETAVRTLNEIAVGVEKADFAFLAKLQQDYSFSDDVDALPAPFTKPALFLTGRFDHVVGYRDLVDLLPNYPHASYAVLDFAGHGLHIEQSHLFNQLVEEWLIRVERAATTGATSDSLLAAAIAD